MNKVGPLGSNDKQMGPIPPAQPTSPSGAASVAKETLSALASQTATPSSPLPAATHLSLPIEETKEQAIKNRDGHLWQCVDRIPVKEGFIYKFMLRDAYDPPEQISTTSDSSRYYSHLDLAKKKNAEIYPAIEKRVDELIVDPDMWHWNPLERGTPSPDSEYGIMKGKLDRGEVEAAPVRLGRTREASEVLESLGYKMEVTNGGIVLYLPDEMVLGTRWNKMVDDQQIRKFHSLSIVCSRDIAGDVEFTQAFIDQKLILSTGSEFAHDHQVHILSALRHMLMDPDNYSQVHEKFSEIVAGLVEQVKKARGLISEKKLKSDPHNIQDIEFYKRLEKNMVLVDSLPSIVADTLAANGTTLPTETLDLLKPLSRWGSTLMGFANFIWDRHAKEISEKYQKEHNGTEIPPAELAAQMEGISLTWLWDVMVKILGEQDHN